MLCVLNLNMYAAEAAAAGDVDLVIKLQYREVRESILLNKYH